MWIRRSDALKNVLKFQNFSVLKINIYCAQALSIYKSIDNTEKDSESVHNYCALWNRHAVHICPLRNHCGRIAHAMDGRTCSQLCSLLHAVMHWYAGVRMPVNRMWADCIVHTACFSGQNSNKTDQDVNMLLFFTNKSKMGYVLFALYKSISPHLEYCSAAWNPHYGTDANQQKLCCWTFGYWTNGCFFWTECSWIIHCLSIWYTYCLLLKFMLCLLIFKCWVMKWIVFVQFLSELTRFFQKSKASSKTVQLTMKKCML